jgi:hypothetical protein
LLFHLILLHFPIRPLLLHLFTLLLAQEYELVLSVGQVISKGLSFAARLLISNREGGSAGRDGLPE